MSKTFRTADYPLARSKGKEVWMTEHFTESAHSANLWPLALDVGKEIHDCMSANFSAYVWWYIRRAYGPMTDDGEISKRGYLLAQYAKFVRPGFHRVGVDLRSIPNIYATAYKSDDQVVVVIVNMGSSEQTISLTVKGRSVDSFAQYTTSENKDLEEDDVIGISENVAAVTVEGKCVTTLVAGEIPTS